MRGIAKRLMYVVCGLPLLVYGFFYWIATGNDAAEPVLRFLKWVNE